MVRGGGDAAAYDRCWLDVYRSHPHTLDLAARKSRIGTSA
jgi:hypothetical protein